MATATAETVTLHHKTYTGLQYGPNSEIVFGPRAGQLPGYAVVPADHPLLPQLLEDEGANVEVVDDQLGGAKAWVSPIVPGREFTTQQGLIQHVKAAAKKGDALAEAWIARFLGDEDAGASAPATGDDSGDGGVHRSHDGVISQDPVSPPPAAPKFGG